MIVVDASVAVQALIGGGAATEQLRDRLQTRGHVLAAPYLLDAEVGQVLRRLVARRELGERRAEDALEDFADLPIHRYAHTPLMQRAFELRDNVSFYDALYVALAEALDGEFWTCNSALKKIRGLHCRVVVP